MSDRISQPGIVVRPAAASDIAAICLLEQGCFPDPWSEEALYRDLVGNPSAHYLAAFLPDGQLTGYIAWWQILDDVDIVNLAVDPTWRRHGIGWRLLCSLIDLAGESGAGRIHLEVRESNQAARHLYDRAGFHQIGMRNGYYTCSGENAITMLKILALPSD